MPGTISRREALQRVAVLLGGAALTCGDRVLALSFDVASRDAAMAQGTGAFTASDVALPQAEAWSAVADACSEPKTRRPPGTRQ